jgi:hypothetical protein
MFRGEQTHEVGDLEGIKKALTQMGQKGLLGLKQGTTIKDLETQTQHCSTPRPLVELIKTCSNLVG